MGGRDINCFYDVSGLDDNMMHHVYSKIWNILKVGNAPERDRTVESEKDEERVAIQLSFNEITNLHDIIGDPDCELQFET